MIKNKAIKALIIGTCLAASTSLGVFADTDNFEVKPAIVDQVTDEDKAAFTIMVMAANDDVLAKKQSEIDQYLFVEHSKEIEEKGITVTHTIVAGDVVEIGITPYSQEKADYLYGIFGKDMVKVVEGQQAVLLEMTTTAVDDAAKAEVVSVQEASFFERIINSIVEFFKSLFK